MSILIKGMEMPTDGTFSIVHIYSDGHVSMPFWGKGMQIVSGITAVPVPPHGRLIDADALKAYISDWGFIGESCAIESVDNAPTIIEAEEGE